MLALEENRKQNDYSLTGREREKEWWTQAALVSYILSTTGYVAQGYMTQISW